MRLPTRITSPVGRAAVFGVATVALASWALVSAGDALPSMVVLALFGVLLVMAALGLTGHRRWSVLLVGSLAAAQILLLEAVTALTCHVVVDSLQSDVGSHHGAQALISGQVSAHFTSATGAEGWSVTMMSLHVLGTLVTALLLARGEQALWRLSSQLLPALTGDFFRSGCRRVLLPVFVTVAPLLSVLSGGPGLRGPPMSFSVAASHS